MSRGAFALPGGGKCMTEQLAAALDRARWVEYDPNGYCLEMYLNPKDVRCMVRMRE